MSQPFNLFGTQTGRLVPGGTTAEPKGDAPETKPERPHLTKPVPWLGAGASIEGKILTKVVGVDMEDIRDAVISDLVTAGAKIDFPRQNVGVATITPKQFSRECAKFGVTEDEVIECVETYGHFYFHCFGRHPSSSVGLHRGADMGKAAKKAKHGRRR